MSADEVKALVRRWFNELNKGKTAALAVMDETCAAEFVGHCARGKDCRGIKDYKLDMKELFTAFPDVHFTLDDMIVEGDKVAIRYTWAGTDKATNKKVVMWQIEIDRVADGKFVECWERYDTLGLMEQLKAVPTPDKRKQRALQCPTCLAHFNSYMKGERYLTIITSLQETRDNE